MSEREVLAELAAIRESIDDLTAAVSAPVVAAVEVEEPVVVDVAAPPPEQVSPAEVLEADGWFEDQGLKLSIARSFGCHRLANRYLTGVEYRDNAAAVAKEFGASERLIRMLGHNLANGWYMFPTVDISAYGAAKFREAYTPIQPPMPYNEEEIRLFTENFLFSHMSGKSLLTGALQTSQLYFTVNLENQERKRFVGAAIPGHVIWTVPNHPQNIIPDVVKLYSNNGWLRSSYRFIIAQAHAIDKGERDPVPGYVPPSDQGGEISIEWWNEHEDGAVKATPNLVALT